MTPVQIAAIREALPKAQQYLLPKPYIEQPAPAVSRGESAVRHACQPIVEAMPAVLDELERLAYLHDLDHKLADRFHTERDACVKSHQKMNADYEKATDVLEAIANEHPEEWEDTTTIAYRMRDAARAFMESE